MAITILNEWTVDKDGVTSNLISANKLSIYFSTDNASIVKCTCVIDSNVLTATYISSDATYKYWKIDLTEFLKYHLIANEDLPEKLFFVENSNAVAGSGLNYACSKTIYLYGYNSTNNLLDSINLNVDLTMLSNELGSETGFNLWNVKMMRHFQDLKWSNDTYNALFTYCAGSGGAVVIYNRTTGQALAANSDANEIHQFKFAKRIQELYYEKRYYNAPNVDALGDGNVTLPEGKTADDVLIIEGARIIFDKTNFTDSTQDSVAQPLLLIEGPAFTTQIKTPNDGKKHHYNIYYPKEEVYAWDGWNQPAELMTFSPIYSGGAHVAVENIRVELELNQNHDITILEPGENVIEILSNDGTGTFAFATFTIDYDPYGCYTSLLWKHSLQGYVSYPFEGFKIEGQTVTERSDLTKVLTSLINDQSYTENHGYDSNKTIEVSTRAKRKYYPLLKELATSKEVYLYVGQTGDLDEERNWLRVKVTGSFTDNHKSDIMLMTFQITLPESNNIKL